MVDFRRVRLKIGRGEHRSEKQPGSEFPADEIGMLALPAETGRTRQRLFHDGRGIDENLYVLFRARREARGDLLQPPLMTS